MDRAKLIKTLVELGDSEDELLDLTDEELQETLDEYNNYSTVYFQTEMNMLGCEAGPIESPEYRQLTEKYRDL